MSRLKNYDEEMENFFQKAGWIAVIMTLLSTVMTLGLVWFVIWAVSYALHHIWP